MDLKIFILTAIILLIVDILFITSASFKLNKNEMKSEPLAGSLFKVKTNSKGNKTNKFLPGV